MNAVEVKQGQQERSTPIGGLTGWLIERFRGASRRQPARLALVERITLAPRQSLALVEAEGRRLLVATSPDGAPAFYSLDGDLLSAPAPQRSRSRRTPPAGRVSW